MGEKLSNELTDKEIFTLHLKKHLKEPNTSFLIILQILNTYMTMLS